MAGKKYTGKEFFANVHNVEVQKFGWGTLTWTIEPRTTGTDCRYSKASSGSRTQHTQSYM